MTYRSSIAGFIVVVSVVCGIAFAQQTRSPAENRNEGSGFAVATSGEVTVLLEVASGRTWRMSRALEGGSVWLPIERIDTRDEANEWREVQKQMREDQIKRQQQLDENRKR